METKVFVKQWFLSYITVTVVEEILVYTIGRSGVGARALFLLFFFDEYSFNDI